LWGCLMRRCSSWRRTFHWKPGRCADADDESSFLTNVLVSCTVWKLSVICQLLT
jgi:hypothetical protein